MTVKPQTRSSAVPQKPKPKKKFCDIAKFFGRWLLESNCVPGVQKIIQVGTVAGCKRPLIWYEQADEDPPRCLEIQPIYIPSRVAIDLEIITDEHDQAVFIAGQIKAAAWRHFKLTPNFDFDGCKVCSMKSTDHDESYLLKAPGTNQGEYGVGVFIELFM